MRCSLVPHSYVYLQVTENTSTSLDFFRLRFAYTLSFSYERCVKSDPTLSSPSLRGLNIHRNSATLFRTSLSQSTDDLVVQIAIKFESVLIATEDYQKL